MSKVDPNFGEWDPWLQLSAGLDKNLCRNPTWRTDTGPYCYYRKQDGRAGIKSCGVSQCGAGADAAKNAEDREAFPMVATFEGLFETDPYSIWGVYQGIQSNVT